MIKYLPLDCETTTFQKGNPYSVRNKLCLLGIGNKTFDIEYTDHSYIEQLNQIQDILNETELLVLFNAKFDLAWLRRYGLDFSHCRIWDCQLVHFILSGQQAVFPSLNQVAAHYGLESKLDTVKEQYWENGIDTPLIPLEVLIDYLVQDLSLTEQVYLKQLEEVQGQSIQLQRLISLSNQDLIVLLEMEWNGIKLNFAQMEEKSNAIKQKVITTKEELDDYFDGTPAYCRNYASNDCLSALLYGGTLREATKKVIGQYKTGDKIGQDRFRIIWVEHVLPRRVEPPRGSALKKEGFFATNEATLRRIKAKKEIRVVLDKILELSKLEKLIGTYYDGLAKLHQEKDWETDYIHGQFNQCVARTGRLSSSAPNLQNFPPDMDGLIISRFT